MNLSPFSGVIDEISDFQSSTYATAKRMPDIEREEQKPEKDMLDLQPDDDWMELIFQNESPVLLNIYKSDDDLSKLLYPRLMDIFLGSQAEWELIGAEVSRVPDLVTFMEVDEIPSLYLIHEGYVIHSIHGVPTEYELSTILKKIEELAKQDDTSL